MPGGRERVQELLHVPALAARALTRRQVADRGPAVRPPAICRIPDHASEARTAASGTPGSQAGLPS